MSVKKNTTETKIFVNPNIEAKEARATLFYNHYMNEDNFPPTLRRFIELYYEKCNYPKMIDEFSQYQKSLKTPIDLRHTLWVTHLQRFLKTKMVYPNGDVFLIRDLPEEEILKLVDYLGYEIGLGIGHGNDNLLGIYSLYKHLFKKK